MTAPTTVQAVKLPPPKFGTAVVTTYTVPYAKTSVRPVTVPFASTSIRPVTAPVAVQMLFSIVVVKRDYLI